MIENEKMVGEARTCTDAWDCNGTEEDCKEQCIAAHPKGNGFCEVYSPLSAKCFCQFNCP